MVKNKDFINGIYNYKTILYNLLGIWKYFKIDYFNFFFNKKQFFYNYTFV